MSQKIRTSVEIDGSLKVSQIANSTFDTDRFLVSEEGTIKYRTGAELLSDLGIATGTASKIQHQVKAGAAINKGQAVYVTGADGTNMIVGLASNATEATSSKTMGLLDNTVPINGFANVVAEGLLDGLNTAGANVGDLVWLGTGGNLIYGLANKPYAPSHLVFIGIVTRVNANNGEIFVKVQNGFELDELHDVDLKSSAPVGNQILAFEGAPVNLWKNKTIPSVLGYTPVPTTRTITINGSTQDLSANRTFSIDTGVTSFNTRTGAVTLTSGDVTTALGYTPYSASNPAGYISSYTETDTLQSVTNRGQTTTNSIYAPNYYDNNNTAYYGDFAGISRMNIIEADNIGIGQAINTSYRLITNGSIYLNSLGSGFAEGSWKQRRGGGTFYDVIDTDSVSSYAVPLSRTITINGVSQDLSANRSFTVTAVETDTLATVTSRGNIANTSIAARNSILVNKSDGSSGGQLSYDSVINQLYLWNSLSSGYFSVYTNNAERLNISSGGAVTANVDMRAPIFYDSNNTGYYGDFASTSRINTINIDTLRGPQGDWLLGYQSGTTYSFGSQAVNDTLNIDFTNMVFSPGTGNLGNRYFRLNKGTSNDGGLLWSRDNVLDWQTVNATGSGDLLFYSYGSGGNVLTLARSGGAVTAPGNMRAPIFYDSDNTGYYGDFNSTTRQYQAISFGDSSRYSAINTTINGAGAGDKLILYGGTSNYDGRLLVGADYDMLFKSQGNSAGKGSFKFYSGLNSSLALTIDGTQGLRAGSSFNTSPAGTYFSHTLAGVSTNRVVNFDGNGNGAPSVWWTNGSRAFAAIDAQDPGMTFWANNGSSWQQQMAVNYGNVTINTDIRSPIFYDSNNTGYYCDPASTSNFIGLTVANTISGNISGSASSATNATQLTTNYAGGQQLNPQVYFNNGIGLKVAMTAAGGYWTDTLWINGYAGGDVPWMCALHTQRNSTPRMYISAQQTGSTSYGTLYEMYSSYNMDAPNKSGTSYYQTNTWLQLNGAYGLYAPSVNGAHWYPNTSSTYGDWANSGSRNGYDGIYSSFSGVNWAMYDGAGNGGAYREANGRWYFYHHVGNNCTGISTSTTSGSYRAYIGGSLYAEGDIVAYSDRRKKENIVTIDSALDKVNKLRGVYYNRIDDESKRRQVGVIAQEIQEILPEVVTYAEDIDEYGVAYGNITGVLIEAIKEQQTQIEELKQLVNKLINK